MASTLFDERLSARVDTILTATAAVVLALIEVARLVSSSRADALIMFALVATVCLAWPLARRYHRRPIVGAIVALTAIALTLDIGWLRAKVPEFLVPSLQGLVACAFIVSARLPRIAAVAMFALVLAFTAVRFVDLGLLGPMAVHGQRSDVYAWAAAGPIGLWLLVALSARPRPFTTPALHPASEQTIDHATDSMPLAPLWANRPHTWWRYYRIALIAHVLTSVSFALFRPLNVAYDSVIFRSISLLAGVTSLGFLASRLLLLRLIEGRSRTSFWSAQDIIAKTLLVLVILLLSVQTYDLAANDGRWQPYILAVASLTITTSITLSASIALLFLFLAGSQHTPSSKARDKRPRRMWAYLVLSDAFLLGPAAGLIAVAGLDRTSALSAAISIFTSVFGTIAVWGLMHTLHRDIEHAAMAVTFSSDETP